MSGKKYFMSCTTAKGKTNFYDNLVNQLDHILYIDGALTHMISPILQEVADHFQEKKLPLDLIYHHMKKGTFEGIVFPTLQAAILDRSQINRTLSLPEIREQIVYFGEGYEREGLKKDASIIKELKKQIDETHLKAVKKKREALRVHHEIEQVYQPYMDYQKANQIADDLIERIFNGEHSNQQYEAVHRFMNATTPEGITDFAVDLNNDINKRIYLKGNSGSGKSTLLRKILKEAKDRGFKREVYHCAFDPNSLDMIILPDQDFALFDATPPHEHDPVRSSDEVLNLSERLMKQSLPEEKERHVQLLKAMYLKEIKQSNAHLKELQKLELELSSIYDSHFLTEFKEVARAEIVNWVEEQM